MDDIPNLFLSRAQQQLHIFGLWVPPKKYRMLYNCMTMLSFLLVYSFITFLTIYIVKVWGDIDHVAESLDMLFTQTSVGFKMTWFYLNMNKTIELFEFMKIETFKSKSLKHEEILFFQARRIKRICVVFLCLVCCTCTLWALKPFLDDADYVLPFTIWLPIPTDSMPNYVIACVYLNLAGSITGLLFNGIDNVPQSMIMFACGQLEIVMDKVSNIPSCRRLASENDRENVYRQLADCVAHHRTIIRFIRQVERTYHVNIFYHVCGSVGIICVIGLRISVMDPNSLKFFSTMTFLQCMLLQLYSYSWCGHKLTTTSEELRDVLYLCPWYTHDKRFNKSLWIAMERMKKPIVFRTGNFIDLSFTTFVSILRSSYSYFAVLKQVRDK